MPRKTVVVKLAWIRDAIAVDPKGACDFHVGEGGKGDFCPGCGCCQLARAFVRAGGRPRPRPVEIRIH